MFFESKEVKEFKAQHFDDMTAGNSLLSDFNEASLTVRDHDDLLMNIQHINEIRRILLEKDERDMQRFINTMTFLYIRYIAKSTIPELERDVDGKGKNPQSLQTIRRQCDLVLELVLKNKKDMVSSIFEMKKNGNWPESFNETNWLGIFKSPDNFLKWTVSKTTSGNPKIIFASSKIVSKIGSLFRVIDAISRID